MGTLPPNIDPRDPRRFPAARMLQLSCRNTGGVSAAAPAVTPAWYTTPMANIWDTVDNDYPVSFARGNSLSGSGPYMKGDPVTGVVTLTAPPDRSLPFYAWMSFLVYNDAAAGNYCARFGMIHYNVADITVDYQVVANAEFNGALLAGGFNTKSASGMGVVPPGRTFNLHVGWDNGGLAGAKMFLGSDRNRFGVMTF